MKQFFKWAGISLLTIITVGMIAFVVWAETPSPAGPAALSALQSDEYVTVTDRGEYIAFAPATGSPAPVGFVFYPGGHVEYRAYAPILRDLAAQGYLVVLVPVRLNLAFFDIDAAAPVLDDYPAIQRWVVGGHSLGGVAAAYFAEKNPEIAGVVFWASYPADDSLRHSSLKMLSVYGTEDGDLDDGAKIEEYKAFQVPDTQFVVIEGGNHAQFGDYGPQAGDKPASISSEEQWQQAAASTAAFLETFTH